MGAFSFLSRKVGRRTAEEMITSGTIYTARQLYDLGVVDVITPDGTGHAAVHGFIDKHSRNIAGRQAFERARNAVSPISEEELMRVVEILGGHGIEASGTRPQGYGSPDPCSKPQHRSTKAVSGLERGSLARLSSDSKSYDLEVRDALDRFSRCSSSNRRVSEEIFSSSSIKWADLRRSVSAPLCSIFLAS
jgi:enoyl-CoA hydratase/carnithine racemase